ncbi:SMI1/KNR4 family protein [Bacillus thuringiensis]|uniref:SMI1/KNR4 family protein n=1 Tax=Bacillus cereus group TaxID=86661 RepID=UPI0020CE80B6|nr:SMI1/KNR4 family protein [Bacillus thuringiensis]MEB8596361.1 SMI1/KNR4 family protein [Bacillus cereus]MEB8834576.1 SMI1/KNR4 family protein [Bacillus cereus]MEC2463025.1 SMI1/KNR4 family protein [Bacillus cereus]MEC3604533.1 SMI1/KNR4 family protein [Bacillus cereus]
MKSTIWADDDYLKLAPINDELIKKAEEVLNVKLPESYITLLKEMCSILAREGWGSY